MLALSNFNSTIVRLKDGNFANPQDQMFNFNSTIVRLKVPIAGEIDPSTIFQFYDSTIKSVRRHRCIALRIVFQFYDSTIKSLADLELQPFQFHFNSTIVRLKEATS